jgi:ankyrin repeat protein
MSELNEQLLEAIENGQADLVKALIEKGAEINARTADYDLTPLWIAFEKGHTEIIELLLEKGADATELLYDACAGGDLFMVRQALTKNPDVNSCRGWLSGFTPLHVCVSGTDQSERQEIIQLLHAAGADLEAKDLEKKLTPLHYTALRNKPLCAKALLQCGANVHAVEVNGATALHGAAFHGNVEVAKVLLDGGADPMMKDRWGNTPASLAYSQGHTDLQQLFADARR